MFYWFLCHNNISIPKEKVHWPLQNLGGFKKRRADITYMGFIALKAKYYLDYKKRILLIPDEFKYKY